LTTIAPEARSVIRTYLTVGVLFTLAASLIWAVNTLFLMSVGLSIFEVMLVNTAFVIGQIIFEVPTGVIADTVGRRASLLLGSAALVVSTLMYVVVPELGWGLPGFVVASVVLGFGFTCQTGATEAWLVDALDARGWEGPKDKAFAWGAQSFGVGMLVGTLLGGFLGQYDLAYPYYIRAGLLVVTFVVVAATMKDIGFEPRPLKVSTFGAETRKILDAGVRYGWRNQVVRPLLWVSFIGGLFFLFGFYSWQRYMLDLLGQEAVWVSGIVQAAFSVAGIAGNGFVGRVMGEGDTRRDPSRVLATTSLAEAGLVAGIGLVGLVGLGTGLLPFSIATGLFLLWAFVFGIAGPIRQGYINSYIPSQQRATVLSLDSFFADAGGAVGQPALGWVADRLSISVSWMIGSVLLVVVAPLYMRSGRAAREQGAVPVGEPVAESEAAAG
jgi:MFS family permease